MLVRTTASTIGDDGVRAGSVVSVAIIISVAAGVGDGSICVDSAVMVAIIEAVSKGAIRVAVGVAVGSNSMAACDWTGIENSTCNRGAPAELPSNDFATRLALLLPTMIITMEFPELQLG